MLYLYLDESGDLGFDFANKNPSRFFTITILAVQGQKDNQTIIGAVKKTLKRKLNPKNKRNRNIQELKATNTTLNIKKYFLDQIKDINFSLYSMSLNKKEIPINLPNNKSRLYNFIAHQVLKQIPLEKYNKKGIYFILDRSKNKKEIIEFDQYIKHQFKGKIKLKTPLDIIHGESHKFPGIQTVDMFSYGFFHKYEKKTLIGIIVLFQK